MAWRVYKNDSRTPCEMIQRHCAGDGVGVGGSHFGLVDQAERTSNIQQLELQLAGRLFHLAL